MTDAGRGLGRDLPSVTLVNGNGTNTLSYTLAPGETMRIEAIAVTALGAAAVSNTSMAAEFLAPSGEVIAESSTIELLLNGEDYVVTFAPFLADAFTFSGFSLHERFQTGLALTELPGGSTIRVTAVEPTWKLTEARIWAVGGEGDRAEDIPGLRNVYLLPTASQVTAEPA